MLRFVLALEERQMPVCQAFLQVDLANFMQARELKRGRMMIQGFCDRQFTMRPKHLCRRQRPEEPRAAQGAL